MKEASKKTLRSVWSDKRMRITGSKIPSCDGIFCFKGKDFSAAVIWRIQE